MPAPPLQDGRPTLTTGQRRQYLDECRFIEVRHLAYLEYKKPDGTPLLKYEDTLDNRESVKQLILGYEIANGWLIPDGTEGQIQIAAQPQPQPQPAVPQGATQMNMPFQPPPNGAPMQAPAPQPYAQQPQQYAPPQPMAAPMAAPAPQTFAAPPVASPQQMAAVSAPQQQEPPAAAPTGRKRRGQGTAVAPPPAAPPPQPQGQVPVQQFAAPQQFAPQPAPQQYAAQPPPMFAPQAPQGFQAPPPPTQGFQPPAPQPQMAAPQAASVDLTPVIQRQDALAKMIETLGGELASVKKELADQKMAHNEILVVLHHMYLSHPSLGPGAADKKTLPDFRAHLKQFIGNPS